MKNFFKFCGIWLSVFVVFNLVWFFVMVIAECLNIIFNTLKFDDIVAFTPMFILVQLMAVSLYKNFK